MRALEFATPPGRQPTARALTAIRDIPARCTCRWVYRRNPSRFTRDVAAVGCPWHVTRGTRR